MRKRATVCRFSFILIFRMSEFYRIDLCQWYIQISGTDEFFYSIGAQVHLFNMKIYFVKEEEYIYFNKNNQ